MSTNYQINQTLHTLAQEKAKKHGLELEIESDKIIYWDNFPEKPSDYHIGDSSMLVNAPDWFLKKAVLLIQADQIRQILWVFRDVLGGLNIKIKECGDGFYAVADEKYIFSLDKNLGFDGYKRGFKKPINKNETYKNLLQNDKFGLQKRIFTSKKELETELKKYYLDVNEHDSAEAICQKWLGGLQPFFNSEPVTVLHELITILESI